MQDQFKLESLTPRELFTLVLWACGQTVKESARHLKFSERSINYYRGRLRCMMNARSSNEVISKLIRMNEYEDLIKLGKKFLTGEIDMNDPEFPLRDCA